jgi:hypothetical protein
MKYSKVRTQKRYGGGGGGGDPKSVSSVPDWAIPYIKNVGDQAQGLYGTGDLSKVAGTSRLQEGAFGAGADALVSNTNSGVAALGDQAARLTDAANTGGYDTTAIKDKAILEAGMKTAQLGNQYGASGTLGSARQAVQQGAQNAATSAAFAEADRSAAQQNFANKMTAEQGLAGNVSGSNALVTGGVASLAKLGSEERGIEQQKLDAPWQGLQRYASTIYGNPAKQQAVASGGGK